MTKFVDDAGLAYFKGKIDNNFLNKVKGGDVDGGVNFKKSITATTINGYSATPLIQGTATLKLNDVVGITSGDIKAVGAESVTKVWNDAGGRIVVGGKNGLATLDADGKIPLAQLGNIDTTFVEVVTKLPETNIDKHMYLLAEAAASGVNQNKYAEYIYTGALPINDTNTYDASKWEKLGDFQAEVDLTEYSKKTNVIANIQVETIEDAVNFDFYDGDSGSKGGETIPAATTTKAGVMTAADKNILTKLANRYPFDISSFGITPNVVELGVKTSFTLKWGYQNEDFHTVSSQNITNTFGSGTASTSVPVANRQYNIADITVAQGADKVTKTLTLTAKADADATNKTRTCSAVFVHAGYCGVVAADKTSLTAAEIIALGNKAVINGKNRTVSITQTNQKLVYAYPAYFGDLTSIKDGNGFQGFSGYTKLAAVTVNGTSYNVYMQNTPATATGSYTFA